MHEQLFGDCSSSSSRSCEAMDGALALLLDELDALECVGHSDVSAALFTDSFSFSPTAAMCTSDAFTVLPTAPLAVSSIANLQEATPSLASAPAKRKRIRVRTPSANTHAKRQKAEIAALSSSVETMELQLALLLQQQERRQAHMDTVNTHPRGSARCMNSTAALKAYAKREMLARQEAVGTHAKLQKLAAEALQMTRKMEATLVKYPSPSQLLADLTTATPALQVRPSRDTLVYRQLERLLQARTRGSEQLHAQSPAAAAGEVLDCKRINFEVHNLTDASAVLMRNSHVMPFSTELIHNLVWRDKRFDEMQTQNSAFTVIERFDSTLYLEKRYTIRRPGQREDVTAVFHSVLQRYVDKQQRIVLAWESVGEWPDEDAAVAETNDPSRANGSDPDSHSSITVREHGWGLVQPARVRRPGTDSSATRPAPVSVLSVSTVLAPDAVADDANASPKRRAMLRSDAVVPTYQLAFAARMQLLENMLLDHSLATRASV